MQRSPIPGSTARRVFVTGGTGTGSTKLTSFDAALQSAGIHNANLIRVSSITPSSATTDRRVDPTDLATSIRPGAYLPSVYATETSDETGDHLYAAVAGVRLEAGYGINVECHGRNDERDAVESRCRRMLTEMADRRDTSMATDVWMRYESCTVPADSWASAVAAIVYQ